MATSSILQADLESFSLHLQSSNRILALCGAGLSAASGLPTFRGAGGLWRSHDAVSLATPDAFSRDPGLVWQFYSYRRHMALQAQPNPAHYALAELAKRKRNFITLSQNVDGLSQRARHPLSQLYLLHGSLFDIRCTSFYCRFTQQNNFTDPIVPGLAIPTEAVQPEPSSTDHTGAEASASLHDAMQSAYARSGATRELDISDDRVQIRQLRRSELPQCPQCGNGLLRPGVVWFGETLPAETISAVEQFIDESEQIDLIMVIGTSARVYPAAGYVDQARAKGAKVAVVNIDRADAPGGEQGLARVDWFFEGDAGVVVPEILRSVVGDIARPGLGQFPAASLR